MRQKAKEGDLQAVIRHFEEMGPNVHRGEQSWRVDGKVLHNTVYCILL